MPGTAKVISCFVLSLKEDPVEVSAEIMIILFMWKILGNYYFSIGNFDY